MNEPRLPQWVTAYRDRHGKARYRFRRKGSRQYLFRSPPGTARFAEEYRQCLERGETPLQIVSPNVAIGSMADLVGKYYQTPEWLRAGAGTRHANSLILERFLNVHGHRMVRDLQYEHVDRILGTMNDRPAAANKLRKLLKRIMTHAQRLRMRADNPVALTTAYSEKTDGFHTWTEDEIAQFESCHRAGTRARRAMALMLYTGQRKSDAIKMGRQHVDSGSISVRQDKTANRLEIPLHWKLKAELDVGPRDQMAYLVTEQGKPFTAAGFGNWFRERCDEAELKHCTAHGLRKAAGRRMAEAGCTAHQIMAVLGCSLKIAMIYTRAADQKHLAREAIDRLSVVSVANPIVRLTKNPVNPPKGKGK